MRRLLLSALGIGFLPGLPGTWASAATAGLLVALHGPAPAPCATGVLVALAAGVAVTLALSGPVARAGGDGDPSWVVTDEVAGMALAIAVADAVPRGGGYGPAVAAFLLFRVLDVLKPGPVGAAERLPGGLGILADDLLAGAAAGGLVAAARALGAFGAG